MTHFMGIDGGGSTLRVVIVDAQRHVVAEALRGTANPNHIGREAAATLIQDAMREALAQQPEVAGVGIGIAGASAEYAEKWLRGVIGTVLPDAHIAPASDNEIALVGALGKRQGVLILSGTGSGLFGVNAAGEKLQVGGWGYLLGDEGSGYWIGLQALKQITAAYDRAAMTDFHHAMLEAFDVPNARALIEAVYLANKPVPKIARLAPHVLQLADDGHAEAQQIVNTAIDDLASHTNIVIERLRMTAPQIAFAGSVLAHDNALSRGLCDRLSLPQRPQAKYPPVIGAALLAQLTLESEEHP